MQFFPGSQAFFGPTFCNSLKADPAYRAVDYELFYEDVGVLAVRRIIGGIRMYHNRFCGIWLLANEGKFG
jgi:hypothetical protein